MVRTKKNARRGGKKTNPRNNNNDNKRPEGWVASQPRNESFEKYYQELGILNEEDWEKFMSTLAETLPTTFRFTGSSKVATELKKYMEEQFFDAIKEAEIDGEKLPVPVPMKWFPNELAWHFDCPKSFLRKSPELGRFHQFLMDQTFVGNISRQEAVSMIPCLFLDIQPSDYVLDMCAAPGSKTSQLIESIHIGNNPTPSGLVIANDADFSRSHTLVYQAKRLNSPCLMVTNHDASKFPSIVMNSKNKNGKDETTTLQFDKILCDVPCSGDGTLRKNKNLWTRWNINQANSLHRVQLQILERGIQMLKVGGSLVYSTCSFNPVENEAVVAEMLRRGKGSVELVDLRSQLPELQSRPGISTWKVMDIEGTFYEKIEDIPNREKKRLQHSIFAYDDVQSLGIEKSMRFYPFLQNTGGFYVAVFQKNAEYKRPEKSNSNFSYEVEEEFTENKQEEQQQVAYKDMDTASSDETLKKRKSDQVSEDQSEEKIEMDKPPAKVAKTEAESVNAEAKEKLAVPATNDDKSNINPYATKVWDGLKESPFYFLNPEHPDIQSILSMFGFKKNFPQDQFMVRSDVKNMKYIYFVSEAVKKIFSSERVNRIKMVHAGVKMFGRNEGSGLASCPYRVINDGTHIVTPFITDARVVCPNPEEMKKLLIMEYIRIEDCSEQVQQFAESAPIGCIIFRVSFDDPRFRALNPGKPEDAEPVIIPGWRGRTSMNTLISAQDKAAIYSRIFNEELATKVKEGKNKDKKEAIQEKETSTEFENQAKNEVEPAVAVVVAQEKPEL